MHYVKQFDINGVATKQVACIELHGKPNAATEGCVGVLGIDMDSPTHDVYKCSAVNGSIYTWELLSSGMSVMSASISGGGGDFVEFPYADIRIPTAYVVKVGDLILDKDGYLYQIISLNSTYCVASYCTRVVAYGMSAYDLAVNNGFEGSEEEWMLSLQGKGLSVKANKSSCTELGDGYIDTNGDLQILTTLPSTFTNCGQIRGPAGESISVSWSIAYYGVSNSASTRPTSWSSSIPTNIAEGQYLWTRTDIRFSDGATASGYTYSKQGAKGDKGDTGANGTSITITDISESTASGGSNVVTFSDGNTLTVKNGIDGKDGENEEIVQIRESSAPGGENEVYFKLGSKLTVRNGRDGTDGKSAYQYAKEGGYAGTEADYKNDSNLDNIKAELEQIEAPTIVSSVAEMTDTTKHYVLNGNIYYNKTVVTEGETIRTYPNQFVPSTAELNKRLSGSSGSASASNGYFVTDFIAVPNYANVTPYNVRLNWEMPYISPADDVKVLFYNASKTKIGYTSFGNEGFSIPNTVVVDGKTVIDLRTQLTGTAPTISDVAYIKLQLALNSSLSALTSADIANCEITLDAVYTETTTQPTTKNEWVNSGISYAPTFKTELVGVLGEGDVIYISDNLPSGKTYTLKYPDNNYAIIGEITK